MKKREDGDKTVGIPRERERTMNVRERIEETERKGLSPFATLSADSRGRKKPEPDCDLRTCFMRDRDRILHSNSFRRLKHKTQVFLSPEGDHYRTRLTHTLEVSQIARTLARALRLNEDLTEAIALGHDLGHTPFGHEGERALAKVSGLEFRHYLQSVRVAERLEKGGEGLNLTAEVLDGFLHHTTGEEAYTAEGRVVRLADHIAYINHDIDDAVRAGLLRNEDIDLRIREVLGNRHSERIDTLINSAVEHSSAGQICLSPEVNEAFQNLETFMFEQVYSHPVAKNEEKKATALIAGIYEHLYSRPEKLPEKYRQIAEEEGLPVALCDYIAGMTDRYAIRFYSDLFIPKGWMF